MVSLCCLPEDSSGDDSVDQDFQAPAMLGLCLDDVGSPSIMDIMKYLEPLLVWLWLSMAFCLGCLLLLLHFGVLKGWGSKGNTGEYGFFIYLLLGPPSRTPEWDLSR